MNQDLYFGYIHLALERAAISELLALWRESAYLGPLGAITRTIITKAIPRLKRDTGVRLSGKQTFRRFVRAYREITYPQLCDKPPLDCVEMFAEHNEKDYMHIAIRKARKQYKRGVQRSVGFKELHKTERSKFLRDKMRKYTDPWVHVMIGAARGGHLELVQYAVSRGADKYAKAFLEAVKAGQQEILQFFLDLQKERGKIVVGFNLQLDNALEVAAENGDWDIVNFLIDNGANTIFDWRKGMRGADRGGHADLRRFFVNKLMGKN